MPECLPAAEGGTAGTADPAYTVKKGDTLWDISRLHLKDPFLWPRIWKQNPSISDPDLIYPGQKLNLPEISGLAPVPGKAESSVAAPGKETKGEEPFVERGQTILKRPSEEVIQLGETKVIKPPIATASDIFRAGFIARDLGGAHEIVGGVLEDREFFLTGALVYVRDTGGLKVGDKFVAGRPGRHVLIPGTEVECGRVVSATGVVELTEKKDDLFVGRVAESFSDLKKTDLLFPVAEPELVYEPVPRNEKLADVWGYLFATMDEKVAVGQGDIMYIGLGAKDGVRPGDRFTIRRSGKVKERSDDYFIVPSEYVLPDVEVGEAQVLAVQSETATVKVTACREPVRVGCRVYYKY